MTPLIIIPQQLVTLWEQAILKYSPRCRNLKMALELHRNNLRLIWQIYTQQRKELGRLPFTDARLVAPYLLGFHLSNVARFMGLLNRSLDRGLGLPTGPGPVRVIDLGAGTAAASHAVFLRLQKEILATEFEFELVDRSRHLLQCGEEILKELAPKALVRTLTKVLNDEKTNSLMHRWISKTSRLNILCLGYVWNELSSNPRLRSHLLEVLYEWKNTPSPTWLLITEPAAEASARGALRLREALIEMGWQVVYPCLRSESCPMGVDGRDWCYSEFDAKKTALQVEVEKILGVSRSTLGTACYALVNPAAAKFFQSPDKNRLTVVGRPIGASGVADLLLCNGSELQKQNSHDKINKGELWPVHSTAAKKSKDTL